MAETTTRPRLVTGWRVFVSIALAAVAGLSVVAIGQISTENPEALPDGVEAVTPPSGNSMLRQGTIVVDLIGPRAVPSEGGGEVLAPGFTGELTVQDIPIPNDQLDVVPQQNLFRFTPGEGKEITTFPIGRICASVRYWREDLSREQDSSTYEWCFNVS